MNTRSLHTVSLEKERTLPSKAARKSRSSVFWREMHSRFHMNQQHHLIYIQFIVILSDKSEMMRNPKSLGNGQHLDE